MEDLIATHSQVWAVAGGIEQAVLRPRSINMESTGQAR